MRFFGAFRRLETPRTPPTPAQLREAQERQAQWLADREQRLISGPRTKISCVGGETFYIGGGKPPSDEP
jgi:hypothetical protein